MNEIIESRDAGSVSKWLVYDATIPKLIDDTSKRTLHLLHLLMATAESQHDLLSIAFKLQTIIIHHQGPHLYAFIGFIGFIGPEDINYMCYILVIKY